MTALVFAQVAAIDRFRNKSDRSVHKNAVHAAAVLAGRREQRPTAVRGIVGATGRIRRQGRMKTATDRAAVAEKLTFPMSEGAYDFVSVRRGIGAVQASLRIDGSARIGCNGSAAGDAAPDPLVRLRRIDFSYRVFSRSRTANHFAASDRVARTVGNRREGFSMHCGKGSPQISFGIVRCGGIGFAAVPDSVAHAISNAGSRDLIAAVVGIDIIRRLLNVSVGRASIGAERTD